MIVDEHIKASEISVVIPVKNNQKGINTFLKTFFKTYDSDNFPREIIIVDNNSEVPIVLSDGIDLNGLDVKFLHCQKPGPACARNVGARHASGKWLLFVDSDCIPTSTMISGYLLIKKVAIGYQGFVSALGDDFISRYYESQQIHRPPQVLNSEGRVVPKYFVTANILINKKYFDKIKGFNEQHEFGGEDIDFGLRLSKLGPLEYAENAVVMHNYDDGLKGFIRRFIAYGKGNRLVEQHHNIHLIPFPFTAKKKSVIVNHFLALLQWLCLLCGYIIQTIKFLGEGTKKKSTHDQINWKIK